MECGVCCSGETGTKMVQCAECQHQACCSCVQTYLVEITSDPHCMNCRQVWDVLFLRKNLEKKFLEGVWKEHRKKILWKRSKRCQDKDVLCACPTCPYGKVMKKSHTCSSCWVRVCGQCHQQDAPHHECSEEQIKSMKMITQITKQCPGCHVPIEKKSGCFQMFCTHCYTAFDWKNGNLLEKTSLHNPHYFDHQRDYSILNTIHQLINNMKDYTLKWIYREFSILVRDIGCQVQQYHHPTCFPPITDMYAEDDTRQQKMCQYLLWVKYYKRGLTILRDIMSKHHEQRQIQYQIHCFKNDLKEILIEYNEHVAECVQLRGYRLFPCNPPMICV